MRDPLFIFKGICNFSMKNNKTTTTYYMVKKEQIIFQLLVN